jgi:hypothetical protein
MSKVVTPVGNALVVAAIVKAYPKEAVDILAELKYDHLMKCWFFWRNGVFVGIEENGYLHT